MRTMTENLLYFGLGAINLTREKARATVNDLVARGEVESQEASSLVDRLMEKGRTQREEIQKMLQEELQKMTGSSPALEERLSALEERLARLEGKQPSSGENNG
jgi:polyhydroxyalkanoate synthesis regulator phasin